MISELENKTFVTNSDAHSLPKIAREYNKMMVEDISFKEVVKALKNEDNRKVLCNYGLDPKLGKYHRTFCDNCNQVIETKEPVAVCPYCGSNKVTFGVFDRIELIKDKKESKSPTNRPPYIYQVPLTFIPGLGAKTIDKLLNVFGTEMDILHKLSKDDIESVVGEKVANTIISAREGNIKIQDVSLDDINPHLWRARLGAVLQDSFIFSDTIANNIAIGEESIDKKRLLQAVEIANIREFIESLPLKYNTKIGMEGNGISQGQKQRLLIARAVYKNPEYLFFDEATNSLDANNERAILDNLMNFYVGKTVVVVAHRLSTVQNADHIIVLDRGKIAEQGTHKQLISLKRSYYTLIKNQLELGM